MTPLSPRIFKTKWFNKAAKVAGIADVELCRAARQLMQGVGDDLGGNVWKKRLDQNRRRGIVVNKIGHCWFFVFLFAKSDRENIDDRELKAFRKLAADFGKLRDAEIDSLVELKTLVEICND
ncbi:type II toxin-antitoxin system RelE/ParE family toxin [Ralstonia wenshanensis]|uniref:type II toxin-antitoxin system RelE/ParE family toxin n=1 Tax=Ralstonia wenshanensis TaxID=2842456 RepID=UPI003D98DBC0